MSKRTEENNQNSYICGKCKLEILYSVNDEPPKSCPECGINEYSTAWQKQSRKIDSVPPKFKLDLTKY